ncbi:cell division protein FtsZ [Desulfosalsimonas propionicica]|jgi:cell division protein FtsZ|uniref:Cell division protein FtsZ n=1 Tax=Desulfosalsimonas propionicica TaxID=332175 RepID=A0A7W0C8I6_9BACT|nr:cell division protein FtsZ [Desulfosalsimonas propionicica]MBA2881141.1 cell division protein FtsZ [Desulfosalsimonas propionicica]
MDFTYLDNENSAKIKVIGVGGGGGNAVNNMIDSQLNGVKFIVANTDAQALAHAKANTKIQLGEALTEGLGAGADPSVGRNAALESADLLREALSDSHMVFIAAGLGGGTGTGAAPVIAEICKELGALTVAVVTKPFKFEARKRSKQAEEGIAQLKEVADTVITIPNDRLRGLAKKNASLIEMFRMADEILHHSVKGITDLIMHPGLINLDFADVKTIMSKSGMAIMGIGISTGDNRAIEAAEKAISHPLLEDNSISGAKGVLMNITCNSELTMEEAIEASERIYNEIGDDDVEIIWGTAMDDSLEDEMRITVIATGIGSMDESEMHLPKKSVRQLKDVKRGVVRDYTSEDREYEKNLNQPTFWRVKQQKAEEKQAGRDNQKKKAVNSMDDYFDMDMLDVPTFLRRKAD